MTTSHAADRNTTPALGWACALLLGLLMAGALLCAALFISSQRDAQNAQRPDAELTTAQTLDASGTDSPSLSDSPPAGDNDSRTPAGSAD